MYKHHILSQSQTVLYTDQKIWTSFLIYLHQLTTYIVHFYSVYLSRIQYWLKNWPTGLHEIKHKETGFWLKILRTRNKKYNKFKILTTFHNTLNFNQDIVLCINNRFHFNVMIKTIQSYNNSLHFVRHLT